MTVSKRALPKIRIAEGNRRLLKLAKLLDQVPEGRFDYETFIDPEWNGRTDLWKCGTAACAAGWATTMPELRALGLRTKTVAGRHLLILSPRNRLGAKHTGRFSTRDGSCRDSFWEVLQIVFGLTFDDAEEIFIADDDRELGFRTGRPAASKIRKFVANRVKKSKAHKARYEAQVNSQHFEFYTFEPKATR